MYLELGRMGFNINYGLLGIKWRGHYFMFDLTAFDLISAIIIIINFIGNSNICRENKIIQSTPKKLCKGSTDKK